VSERELDRRAAVFRFTAAIRAELGRALRHLFDVAIVASDAFRDGRAITHGSGSRRRSRSGSPTVEPHVISFVACRPPPGKAVVPKATRAVARAVAHPDATRPPVRLVRERAGSSPTVPHSITFDAAIKPPR